MVDIASKVLGGFQDDLISAFGDALGWTIGHLILLGIAGSVVLGIRNRDHIINHSGLGRTQAYDGAVTLITTILLFYIYTSIFNFDSFASVGISVASSLSLRWMVTVLG